VPYEEGAGAIETIKKRLLCAARSNFAVLASAKAADLRRKYFAAGGVRKYLWAEKFFNEQWSESCLKWFAYQSYDDFLDEKNWILLDAAGMPASSPGAMPLFLAATQIRVMLFRDGFPELMYTLPRATTFEVLKALVEADVQRPGCFTKFDVGTPGDRFGPTKSLADVLSPTTVGVSHAWA
jgi:hypothetical protein